MKIAENHTINEIPFYSIELEYYDFYFVNDYRQKIAAKKDIQHLNFDIGNLLIFRRNLTEHQVLEKVRNRIINFLDTNEIYFTSKFLPYKLALMELATKYKPHAANNASYKSDAIILSPKLEPTQQPQPTPAPSRITNSSSLFFKKEPVPAKSKPIDIPIGKLKNR